MLVVVGSRFLIAPQKARLSARKETVNALGYVIIARDIEIHAATLVERGGGGITRFSPARIIGLSSGTQAIHASVKYQEKNIILSAKILIGAACPLNTGSTKMRIL